MRLVRALSDVEARKVQTFVLLGGVFTTLAIWTKLEDPVNLPKMFVLVLSAAIVLGLALPAYLSARKFTTPIQQIGLGLIVLFGLGLLIATMATDVKYTAIFGEYHRNNGALSYLAMAILAGACTLVFNLKSSDRYLKFYAATGLILTAYGFIQAAGKDPVGWTIDYNPFITTLGNPNFTSAFLGLAGVAILLLAIESSDRKYQVLYAVGLLADLYILNRSGSIQGLFGFLIGATIIIIVKLWLLNKKYGQISLILAAFGATPVALAVFNVGPLASKLYQGTLRNRSDYWNASINMFKEHPIFGVGIDRFGEYYREYAVQNQVVQGQITDNAHSVYMQILATGGLITFIPYFLIICYITYIGFKAMLKASGSTKLRIAGVFGIWLGTVVVNIVAIDNLGVAIWFWITGGVLIALSSSTINSATFDSTIDSQQIAGNSKFAGTNKKGRSTSSSKAIRNNSDSEFPITTLASGVLVVLLIVIMLPTINKSIAIRELKSNSMNLTANSYITEINRQVADNQSNPQNLILLADIALRQAEVDLTYQITDRIRQLDARSFYGQYLPAVAYEVTSKPVEAIKFREKLVEFDPWNTSNMLQLIKNYLAVGDKTKAAAIAALIKQNYPGSQADIDAAALLVG
jgi:O-antigen ligase